jgi:fluoroquinolone transport system ATP-binding protein
MFSGGKTHMGNLVNIIAVEKLDFRYQGQNDRTLRDLTFGVEEGEIFGFLGPSASGKSTTQKLLTGLLTGYEGSISLFDKEVSGWNNSLYRRVGVAFELPNHFKKLTGLENLRLFASLYGGAKTDLHKLLERLGLSEAAHRRVAHYSKGMGIRLNLARAIVHDPQLLFLDEPTAGLDPINAQNVRELIRELRNRGKTIFLTTHNMHDVDALCDRVALLVRGKIVALDAPRQLNLKHGSREVVVEYRNGAGAENARFALDGLSDNQAFLELMRSRPIVSVHSQEATLDDVFIKVTGEALA